MKDTPQTQEKQAEGFNSEGGQSQSPPAFNLSGKPLQAKAAGQAPVQMKVNPRNESQIKQRADFECYRDLRSAQIADPKSRAGFLKKANDFIAWADEKSGLFDSDQRWGNGEYKKRIARDFPDYGTVLAGEIQRVKSAAIQEAQTAVSSSKAALANAKLALEQASSNLAAAEKAATEAENSAKAAEASALEAETSAALPDAGEPEKQAAVKAREAAKSARASADAAKKAVEGAKGNKEMAQHQSEYAGSRLTFAENLLERTNGISQLQDLKQQQKGSQSFNQATDSFSNAVKTNVAASDQSKTDAEGAAGTAKTEAEKAQAEALNAKAIPGLNEKLKALGDATTDKDRKARAKELMALGRAEIAKFPALVTAYKDQPNPTPDEKIRVIGEMAAKAARIEWLMGTIYLEGSDNADKWKGKGLTKDEEKLLGNYYESKVGAASGGVWCTAFLGTIFMTVAGLKTAKGGTPNGGQLWSGYKLGKHGKAAIFDFSQDQGGEHVGLSEAKNDSSFKDLHKSIKAEKDRTKREEIVAQFFKDHFTPQAGDQMIVKRSTNKTPNTFIDYKSHTTMVEKVEGTKIYTIEGNASNRVQGRVYDLAEEEDSAKIVFISRFSLNNFGNKPDPKKKWEGTELTESQLLGPLDKLSNTLLSFAQGKGYVRTLGADESNVVSNLKQGGGAAGAGE